MSHHVLELDLALLARHEGVASGCGVCGEVVCLFSRGFQSVPADLAESVGAGEAAVDGGDLARRRDGVVAIIARKRL